MSVAVSGVQESFDRLIELLQEPARLKAAADHLEWDGATNTPRDGQAGLTEIKADLERRAHETFTGDGRIRFFLEEVARHQDELSAPHQCLIDRLYLAHQRAKALPSEFVSRRSIINGLSHAAWMQARDASDFSAFAPHLEQVLEVVREEAALRGGDPADPSSLYTALLQGYEPGLTTERLRAILNGVRNWLVPFLDQIRGASVQPSDAMLHGIFPAERQRLLAEALLRRLGLNFNQCALSTTAHPFCSQVGPNDTRVACNFPEDKLSTGLFGTIHEGGHALYGQGMDPVFDWITHVPEFTYSLGLHESQSRLWENLVGRSESFWRFCYPLLQTVFPMFYQHPLASFLAGINKVEPSLIRIKADEVTYNLHVLFRVELELALLSGDLKVADLPEAWNDKMRQYVGCEPETPRDGVLQDIHWSWGAFGYFGTYTLGNLASAQIFRAFSEPHPISWGSQFESGNFKPLLGWLREKVHPFGMVTDLDYALIQATGTPLDPQHWFRYIEKKYGALYQI